MVKVFETAWTIAVVFALVGVPLLFYGLASVPLMRAIDGLDLLRIYGPPNHDPEWQRPIRLLQLAQYEPLLTMLTQIGLSLRGYGVVNLSYIIRFDPDDLLTLHAPQWSAVGLSCIPALLLLAMPGLLNPPSNSLIRLNRRRLWQLLALRTGLLVLLACTGFVGLIVLAIEFYVTNKLIVRWSKGVRDQQTQGIDRDAAGVRVPPLQQPK